MPSVCERVAGRLLDMRSADSGGMALRPALDAVQRDVRASLTKVLQSRQNTSMMVIGPPGCGKTTVRSLAVSTTLELAAGAALVRALLHPRDALPYSNVPWCLHSGACQRVAWYAA